MEKAKEPIIYSYLDYRKFLSDYVSSKKGRSGTFSYRAFAKRAGINSPNYLQKTIEGSKNLGTDSIEKFVKALQLKAASADYFRSLVVFNQSKSTAQKAIHLKKIEKIRKARLRKKKLVSNDMRKNWWTMVVWELASCKDFKLTPESVSQVLSGKISPARASHTIEELIEQGYLKNTSEKDVYEQAPAPATSTDEISNVYVNQLHHHFTNEALAGLDLPLEVREYQGLTIAISKKKFQWLKSKLKEMSAELLDELACDPDADQIYRVNIQAFPVSNSTKIKNKGETRSKK